MEFGATADMSDPSSNTARAPRNVYLMSNKEYNFPKKS
jgi:hypothetical protein